jgi:hypothetical protein
MPILFFSGNGFVKVFYYGWRGSAKAIAFQKQAGEAHVKADRVCSTYIVYDELTHISSIRSGSVLQGKLRVKFARPSLN